MDGRFKFHQPAIPVSTIARPTSRLPSLSRAAAAETNPNRTDSPAGPSRIGRPISSIPAIDPPRSVSRQTLSRPPSAASSYSPRVPQSPATPSTPARAISPVKQSRLESPYRDARPPIAAAKVLDYNQGPSHFQRQSNGPSIFPTRVPLPSNVPVSSEANGVATSTSIGSASNFFPTSGLYRAHANEIASQPSNGLPTLKMKIDAILTRIPDASVDALKELQKLLLENDRAERTFAGLEGHFLISIAKQFSTAFTEGQFTASRSSNLDDNRWFRVAKHVAQTLNQFCLNSVLAKSVEIDAMSPLLDELTLRLLESDGRDGSMKQLSQFLNSIILNIFNHSRRIVIFEFVLFV